MISFDPLWKTLLERHMNKGDLQKAAELSSATIAKMSKNESVTLDVVDRVCMSLQCGIEDVVSIFPTEE